jgi:uroporphyrin-III C-methyltransferase / precorrin-2 dehydrogenase / sirohydrochlorin ferrochelatase
VTGGRKPGTPVAVVCDGTMPTQRTVLATLSTLGACIADEGVQPPAIIVVGEVVRVAFPETFAAADG